MIVEVKEVEGSLVLEIPKVASEELGIVDGDPFRVFLSWNGEKASIVYEPVKES